MAKNPVDFKPLRLLGDEPVPNHEKDELGTKPYAEIIAGAAVGTEGPFTIGVYGGWGTGKTSVLRQARSLINAHAKGHPEEVTVWFNAWKYEKEPEPLTPLLASIISAIDENQSTKKKASTALTTLGNALRALAYGVTLDAKAKLPGIADIGFKANAKDMINRFGELEAEKKDAQLAKTYLMNIFDELDTLADQKNKAKARIIVFIDDLDRCQPDKALHLLENIKLVLAQKGFIFVLAVDRPKIEAYLTKRYKDDFGDEDYIRSGTSYFDKIVQLPLPLPPHKPRFNDYVEKLLNHPVIADDPEIKDALTPMVELLSLGAINNPRSLVRLVNNLLVDWHLWQQLKWEEPSYEVMPMAAVARIFRQHLGERLYRRLVKNHDLCNQLSMGREIKDLIDEQKRNAELPGAIELFGRGAADILRQIEEHEGLEPLLKEPAVFGWLTNAELRDKIDGFLAEQREEAEAIQSQQEIVDGAIRAALDLPADERITEEHLTGISELDFFGLPLNNSGLAQLTHLTDLQTLLLNDTGITDAGLAQLTHLTGLQELWLDGTGVTDAGLAQLTHLTGLQRLSLGDTGITDAGLAQLTHLTGLQGLSLGDTGITDAGLAQLTHLTGLQWLGLGGTGITDAGLAQLTHLTGLQWLWLNNTGITDAGLAQLTHLTGLQRLVLGGTGVTDAGLAQLTHLTGLQWLGLGGTGITDAGLAHLTHLTGLQKLWLGGTGVSDAAKEALQSKLPALKIYD